MASGTGVVSFEVEQRKIKHCLTSNEVGWRFCGSMGNMNIKHEAEFCGQKQ